MYSDKQIAERIKDELKAKGWSQQDLCDKVYISKQTLSNYLGGRHIPSVSFGLIAEALNCSEAYLLGLTDARDPWKAVALDELALTKNAVDVIMGKSPQKHQRICSYIEAGELDREKAGLDALESRAANIHKVVAALLDTPEFEDALSMLENGLAHKAKKRNIVILEQSADGRYRNINNSSEWYAKFLRTSTLNAMGEAYDSLIEKASEILLTASEKQVPLEKEVSTDGE